MKKITAVFLALVLCLSLIAPSAFAAGSRDYTLEQTLASDLKSLSLFKGVSDTDFDLERAPTRTEALVMLIRVLGKESEATGGTWTHPFTDVAPWADKYVGYAYQNGLTKGVSDTQFGTGNAGASTYLTFILRALGYTDSGSSPDFTFSDPYTLAKSLDILPSEVDTTNFMRADAVLISYAALPVKMKGSSETLAGKLISDGVFTQEQYDEYYDAKAIDEAAAGSVLTSEDIYSKCSPAVFYIEVYDSTGKATASGSGFFIDSNGTAVTNFHVIDGASSAKITVSGTGQTYDVAGVYDYDSDNDWAVLKINGTGFPYLTIGSASTVVGGASVYAIGSPLGLQNSISEGLISNPSRIEDGVNYIQTSAAISSGSSGGALLNKYGQVIGITSGSYIDGQNLNLALPITYISGYSTAAAQTLSSLVSTSSAVSIDVSTNLTAIAAGSNTTVFAKWHSDNPGDSVKCSSADPSIASATIGTSVSSSVKSVVITGLKEGTTTVTVYIDDHHSCKITVTVDSNDPYTRLRNYIKAYGTYDSELSGYYLEFSYKSVDYYLLFYPGETHDLCFMSYTETGGNGIMTSVYCGSDSVAYFDCNVENIASGNEIDGMGHFTKSSYVSDAAIAFDKYEGDTYYEDTLAEAAATCIQATVTGAEVLLRTDDIPINIGDLGFTAMYRDAYNT